MLLLKYSLTPLRTLDHRTTSRNENLVRTSEDYSTNTLTSSTNTATAATTAISSNESNYLQIESPSSLKYQRGIEFVEIFQNTRIEKGILKMD